ncbi:heavy-metal-associated domain-containing protein [Leptospira sp. GIMC2001]|uniref:heavy-metal-associated domain-containing protein n=1 Tax=Leptospira sp. GIMC2001 TaxID=1513297 RepID=UPI00234B85C2|nr:heavy-metal-associated domain-containing protein [Leptospira sp. GIMC2001]WCL49482.1 heavy-metal-associated domain-containing protein [Leptospira sp. GIMC2001]
MNIEYRLEGMTCGHCEMTVEEVFLDNGFQAKADRSRNIVTLDSEISEDSLFKIKENLQEGGYSLGNKINS